MKESSKGGDEQARRKAGRDRLHLFLLTLSSVLHSLSFSLSLPLPSRTTTRVRATAGLRTGRIDGLGMFGGLSDD